MKLRNLQISQGEVRIHAMGSVVSAVSLGLTSNRSPNGCGAGRRNGPREYPGPFDGVAQNRPELSPSQALVKCSVTSVQLTTFHHAFT